MFAVIFYTGLLSLTAHVVQSKCIETPQVPDGITVHKVIRTWEEADLQCKSEGAVLASPINTELLNTMKSLISMNNAEYFIGTRVNHYPGPFMSVEGVPLDNMTAAVLEMVQQLDPRDGDCLSMDEHNIRVVPCCKRLPFICYKAITDNNATEMITERTVQDLTATEQAMQEVTIERDQFYTNMSVEDVKMIECETSHKGYEYNAGTGSCYKKHTELLLWDDALAACEAERAHLLVIDDSKEMQVFKNMNLADIAPYAFIGLRDYDRNGEWRTVTGKSLSDIYIDWHYGHPQNDDMTCAVLYPEGDVDNLYCHTEKAFICEKEIGRSM